MRQLPAILDDGFEEPEIVKILALWRLAARQDEKKREDQQLFDKKAYEIWSATAASLETLCVENLMDETADDLDQSDLEEGDLSHASEIQRIVLMLAGRILAKNPGLLHTGVNIVDLTRRLNNTGRNEPCPCGTSRKEFKRCCGST
jgi:uncharacterized protein YecA (UPF0149 family)